MLRPRLKTLGFCLAAGILSVALLYFLSDKINHRPNGFVRLMPPHFAIEEKHLDLKYNSFYLGGMIEDTVLLFTHQTPYEFDKVPLSLNSFKCEKITWTTAKISKACRMMVDSPYISLNDGFSAVVRKQSLSGSRAIQTISTPPFWAATPMSPNTECLKIIDKSNRGQLIKFNMTTKNVVINDTLLDKQGDGLFGTDGILLSTPDKRSIIYLYYYRNQFIVADTNLKVRYRGRTIDTISHPDIKVSSYNSGQVTTLSAPPLTVNKKAYATNKFLFVNSALAANNEDPHTLEIMSVIDVYDIANGKYLCSFYLPDFGGHKISDFEVHGKRLIALYNHYIMVYQLHFDRLTMRNLTFQNHKMSHNSTWLVPSFAQLNFFDKR